MVRPLNIILTRIARREQRIENMRNWEVDQKLIDFEIGVLASLKNEYITRTNRLRLYMGVV